MDITFDQWWNLLSEEQKKDVFRVYQMRLGQRFDTKMGINEQESLARQLWVLFHEAIGDKDIFKPLADNEREAWIQVAQFVIQRQSEPLATDANPIKRIQPVQVVSGYDEPSDLDRELMRREMVEELRRKRSWDQDRFILKDFDDYPDHK